MAFFDSIWEKPPLSFAAASASSLLVMTLVAGAAAESRRNQVTLPSSQATPMLIAENGLSWSRGHGLVPLHHENALRIAQDEGAGGDDSEVAPVDVEKYIEVQKAMQKNHSLTVEQACSQQGIQVASFRNIENRIERDDALRERVRKALRDSTAKAPAK